MSDKDILLTLLCRELIKDLGLNFECDNDRNEVADSLLDENTKNEMHDTILEVLDKRYKEMSVEVQ